MGWISPDSDDSWPVHRSGNEMNDSEQEGFGNYTPPPEPPTGEVPDGFLTLAEQLGDALLSDEEIHLLDDGQTHSVRIVLGEKPAKVQAQEPAPATRKSQCF